MPVVPAAGAGATVAEVTVGDAITGAVVVVVASGAGVAPIVGAVAVDLGCRRRALGW